MTMTLLFRDRVATHSKFTSFILFITFDLARPILTRFAQEGSNRLGSKIYRFYELNNIK
jgi:hypothetical protein